MSAAASFVERFDRLDPAVWTPAYLPAWSSVAAAAATFEVGAGGLELSIPPEQPLWCPDTHPTPLRVSAVQSANRSGPVGSTDAQQPFAEGLTVREQQPTVLGLVPHHGTIAVTCAAHLGPGSMFSAWMVGLEDHPERSGEICLVEVFASSIRDGRADVGQGIHPFRDPALRDDFTATPSALDLTRSHTFAATWTADGVRYSIDGRTTHESRQAPDYPMMLILGLFDFPDERGGDAPVPRLRVSEVTGVGLGPGSLPART